MRVFTREDLHLVWEELVPFLERSVSVSSGYTVEHLQGLLSSGKGILFAAFRDNKMFWMIIAECIEYPTYRAARVTAHAGEDLSEAYKFQDMLDSWALMMGAVEIEGCCSSPAMVRLLGRAGYTPKYTVVSRNLRRKLQ